MIMSLATGVEFAGSFYGTSENDFLSVGLGDDVTYAAEGTYLSSTERSTAAKATISL